MRKLELAFAASLDGQVIYDPSLRRTLMVDDVYEGEIILPSGTVNYDLGTRIGSLATLGVVRILATRTSGTNVLFVQIGTGGSGFPLHTLDHGGLLLRWNMQLLGTKSILLSCGTGTFVVQYLVGGYR